MTTLNLKWIHSFRDRHGKRRHYFRRPGYRRVALPGLPGSSEFMSAYEAALAGEYGIRQVGADRSKPGTIGAAVAGYLQSLDYLGLGERTKPTYRRALDAIRREHGDKPVRLLQKHHIKAIMAQKVATPAAANNFLRFIKIVIDYAIEMGWRRDDPTVGIKKIKYETDGFHTWSEEEIELYENCWPLGSTQRVAFDLLLYTGQRSADVRQMRRDHFSEYGVSVTAYDTAVDVKQQKTKAKVTIPIVPALQASLNTIPAANEFLLMTTFGKPFTEKGFSNFMSKAATKAGLPHCTAHGLRKSAATRLAEAGCTEHEIMAVTGHSTSKEVARYTKAARAKILAQGAMAKMEQARLRQTRA